MQPTAYRAVFGVVGRLYGGSQRSKLASAYVRPAVAA